jgi:hypothetical protein
MEIIKTKRSRLNHFNVSIVKSVLRVIAGVSLILYGFPEAGALFIIAEVLGVVEEIV